MVLTVSPQALAGLERASWPAFLAGLQRDLAGRYPHFLPRFAEPVRQAIVANMVGRARLWGIDRQNTIVCYCGWMITVAAGFDEEPEIAAALRQLGPDGINGLIFGLPERVSAAAWARAERDASTLPFFITPDLVGEAPAIRTQAAIPLVLAGRPEATRPAEVLAEASAIATSLGLEDMVDAPLVIAVCISHFGANFTQQAWLGGVLQRRLPPHALVEALRLRLALAAGAYV